MSINVTNTYRDVETTLNGAFIREAKLAITGLTAGAVNTVAHGLPASPIKVLLVSQTISTAAPGAWSESKDADATNIYITVGTSGPTAGNAYCEY